MKLLFHVLLIVISTSYSTITLAQIIDWPWIAPNSSQNGSTISAFLATTAKTKTSYSADVQRLRKSVAIVFVPGILGTALKTADGENIWGHKIIPSMEKLQLPPKLLDHKAKSDVQRTVALGDENGTINLYGDAIKMIRESAAKIGIPNERITSCGYDWRRDIRAAADDLAECIDSSSAVKGAEAIVLIAHSMGGVVTFQWYYNNIKQGSIKSTGAQVIGLAILGSPLAGSCEIVRMISVGYQQPTIKDKHQPPQGPLSRFWDTMKNMKDRSVNAFTAALSDDMRPVVLSWPGALGLSPPPAQTVDDTHCASVPFDRSEDPDPTDVRVLSHYDPMFWSSETGKSMLSGQLPPQTLTDSLAAARAFRSQFTLTPLDAPTYLFASELWDTPSQPKLAPPSYALAGDKNWHTVDGDGRVPIRAAMPTELRTQAADALHLYSVHGNLPEDALFHLDFFANRFPRFLDAWIALKITESASNDTAFLNEYVKAGGKWIHPYDMHGAWERQRKERQVDPTYNITIKAWNSAVNFNENLCKTTGCPDYAAAKKSTLNVSPTQRASVITAAISAPDQLTPDQIMFLSAKRGLDMATQQNWVASLSDLRYAVPLLEAYAIKRGAAETSGEKELRTNASVNLGRALVMRGFCAEAEPHIRRYPNHPWSKDAFRGKCYDRDSGKIVFFSPNN